MIDDEDPMQISENCFNICEVLKAMIQGKNLGDLNEYVRITLEDLERCACSVSVALSVDHLTQL